MLKTLLATALVTTTSFSALALELKGHLTQGGLVTGKLENVKSVSLDGKTLAILCLALVATRKQNTPLRG